VRFEAEVRLKAYAGAPEYNWRIQIEVLLENIRVVVLDETNVAVSLGADASDQFPPVFGRLKASVAV
jgi:hypothetical protein